MKRKRLLSILMCLALLLGTTGVLATAADKPEVNIVALGDSIARGFGCSDVMDPTKAVTDSARQIADHGSQNAYSAVLAKQIESALPAGAYEVHYKNYGIDGYRATDVLRDIAENTDAQNRYGVGTADAVKRADVITISLGGNELMGTVVAEMCKLVGGDDIDDIGAKITEPGSDALGKILSDIVLPILSVVENPAVLGLINAPGIHAVSEETGVVKAIRDNAENDYRPNMKKLLDTIYKMNPDVRVIITTVENPVNEQSGDTLGVTSLGPVLDYFMAMYNNELIPYQVDPATGLFVRDENGRVVYDTASRDGLNAYQGGWLKIADTHRAFQESDKKISGIHVNAKELMAIVQANMTGLLNGDLSSIEGYITNPEKFYIDPHPSNDGQQVIAGLHYALLTDYVAELKANAIAPEPSSESEPAQTTKKQGRNPGTGDTALAAAAAGLTALAAVLVIRRKKEQA